MSYVHRAIAFGILSIAAMFMAGYFYMNDYSLSDSNILDLRFPDSLPSGFFTKMSFKDKEYVYAYVNLSGQYNNVVEFDTSYSDIVLDYVAPESLFIGEQPYEIVYYSSPIYLEGFRGKVVVGGYRLVLDGDVEGVRSNDSYLAGPLNVKFNSSYTSFRITNVSYDYLVFDDFSGKVVLLVQGDEIIYAINNKQVELKDLQGDFIFYPGKVEFLGNGILRTSILNAPLN